MQTHIGTHIPPQAAWPNDMVAFFERCLAA